jgi:hypothetical protein
MISPEVGARGAGHFRENVMLERRLSNTAYTGSTLLIVFAYAYCFAISTGLAW